MSDSHIIMMKMIYKSERVGWDKLLVILNSNHNCQPNHCGCEISALVGVDSEDLTSGGGVGGVGVGGCGLRSVTKKKEKKI